MRLNIFTNSDRGNFQHIKQTYNSLEDTFGELPPLTIYCDIHPDKDYFPKYEAELENYFDAEIIQTRSLSDGYVKSIKEAEDDYLFQCEHDWGFQGITHSLDRILEVIKAEDLFYFRFPANRNSEKSEGYKWQTFIESKEYDGFKYCIMDNFSNRPHIIDRKYYLHNMLDKIEVRTSSFGIEQNLTAKGYRGATYGGLGEGPFIKHLDPAGNGRSASSKSDIKNEKL